MQRVLGVHAASIVLPHFRGFSAPQISPQVMTMNLLRISQFCLPASQMDFESGPLCNPDNACAGWLLIFFFQTLSERGFPAKQ
jgi:hypothetical protein